MAEEQTAYTSKLKAITTVKIAPLLWYSDYDILIEESTFAILNFLNRKLNELIPYALVFTHANILADLIKANPVNADGEDVQAGGETEAEVSLIGGKVQSIKTGDTTITYASSSSVNNSKTLSDGVVDRENELNKVIYNYSAQLYKFRKLRW
jgi:hypothetical protein